MKDMFGMHRNPEENVCLKYEIRAISKETQTKVESHLQEGQNLDKQYPRWLLTAGAFALATGLFLCVLMFVAKDGFVEAMKNRGYIFYIGLAIFLVGIGFIAAHLVLLRKQKKDPEVSDFIEKSDRFIKEIKDELNVPEDAKEADLLCSFVKTNSKGEEKLVQSALVNRNNVVCTLFLEGDNLCISDQASVFAFPLSKIERMEYTNKRVSVTSWNKSEKPNSPKYKEYKVVINGNGFIFVRGFYSFIFKDGEEEYSISFPNYEIEILKSVFKESEVYERLFSNTPTC